MRYLRFISLAVVILIVGSATAWFFWAQGHSQKNSTDDYALPSESQRAAVLALIPQKGAGLYSIPDSQVQNISNLPQVDSYAVSSMVAQLHPLSLSTAAHRILPMPPSFNNYQPSIADLQYIQSAYISPLQLAYTMQPTDPQLINWLQNWQSELINKQDVNDDDRKTLADILSRTQLSWFQLYELCEAFNNYTADSYTHTVRDSYDMNTGDYRTVAVFAIEVVKRVHEALTNYVPGAAEARPMLLAIQYVKGSLWDVVDVSVVTKGLGQSSLAALFTVTTDLIHWVKPGDLLLESALQHAKIGLTECYVASGDEDRAIAYGQSIDQKQMTLDERVSVAWALSMAFSYEHRYKLAADQYRIITADPQFEYYQLAIQQLAYINSKHPD